MSSGVAGPNFQKVGFTLAERTNQESPTNHTKDDQSVFLPTPSPKILEKKLINALRISQLETESILKVSV